MDEYYFSCVMCLSSLIRTKGKGGRCALVLELTESLLGRKMPVSHIRLMSMFDNFILEVHDKFDKTSKNFDPKVMTHHVQNYLSNQICTFLKDKLNLNYTQLTLPRDGGGWQDVDAPWIWLWIHTTSIHMDVCCGTTEKTFMINLIEDMIACSICKEHYRANKQTLIVGQTNHSMTNLFLMLHTHTKNDYGTGIFTLDTTNIITSYKQEFLENYVRLRQNNLR